jgi:acetolactate synthase-1/2/3 large subunit
MIPSGKAHNEMIMAGDTRDLGTIIDDSGKGLV